MSANNGGSAFPTVQTQEAWARGSNDDYQAYGQVESVGGMSLRDYFAAKAMQAAIGMLAGNRLWNEGGFFTSLAKTSYEMADAMLAAREATP